MKEYLREEGRAWKGIINRLDSQRYAFLHNSRFEMMTTLAVLLILVHDRGDLRLRDSGQKVSEYTTMLMKPPPTVAHLTNYIDLHSILSG
jgi:hypothetical protein